MSFIIRVETIYLPLNLANNIQIIYIRINKVRVVITMIED